MLTMRSSLRARRLKASRPRSHDL
ncbi:hypothetical protein A2U01_0109317, partial [Trifolium medium]|nr:hypothetical protein [Trifolium medium]